jgi:hypothetical protein
MKKPSGSIPEHRGARRCGNSAASTDTDDR